MKPDTIGHTPGPWIKNGYRVYSGEGTATHTICSVSGEQGPEMQEANARLIAAAPDLLAALHATLYEHSPCEYAFCGTAAGKCGPCMVRAAIAKALGK